MAIERQPYPFGWSQNGEMVNHNNYDLAKVTLLREPLDSCQQWPSIKSPGFVTTT